ncbi:unnamed protein product [Ilex paraguariensis]|uniref:Uncharacterized protein n=1 Tax=Ilex paraguariensis TaxID=185542 RepID=A0ABC8S8V7_9AQUA
MEMERSLERAFVMANLEPLFAFCCYSLNHLDFTVSFKQMAEVTKLLYIVVVEEDEKREEGKESFRYTRPVLQSTLQLMGCKARHGFKISQRVFVE